MPDTNDQLCVINAQVMPVAVSVTPPARSKQPAAAVRTLSPSLTPPPAVPSFSPMLTPSPPALTAPSVVTADSPVVSPPSPSVVPSLLSGDIVADGIKQGGMKSGVRAASPGVTAVSPVVMPKLAQAVTPEPSRLAHQGASRLGSKSLSAQKPPLHPQGSLTPTASKLTASVTPAKQASTSGDQSSNNVTNVIFCIQVALRIYFPALLYLHLTFAQLSVGSKDATE